MDEYISRNKMLFELGTSFFPQSMEYTEALGIAKRLIQSAPTADVVPKSEVEELRKENTELIKEAVFSPMERAHTIIATRAEVAREIFADLEKCFFNNEHKTGVLIYEDFSNLRKKYMGDSTE